MRFHGIIILCFLSTGVYSQDYVINAPQISSWYNVHEGDTIDYQFQVINKDTLQFQYNIIAPEKVQLSFDSLGNFQWVPDYDLVDRIDESKSVSFIIEASSQQVKISKELQFFVTHRNRPPMVGELPIFYVEQYHDNDYYLNKNKQVKDPDGDPIVFNAVPEELPQGAQLSELGVLSWRPSRGQFRSLKSQPISINFTVQDQPNKEETTGTIIIKATEIDLPPEVQVVPSDSIISVKEDEVVNLNLYVTDPNGDDDLSDVGFVTNSFDIPKEALTKYTNTQWEFKWMPGYEIIQEPGGVDTLDITFYAIDISGKKSDRTFTIAVADAENIIKKDLRLYNKYKSILLATMDLINQLDAHQKTLNKQLKQAKKGKKHRSILNASLGAVTGVTPVFMEESDAKNYVSGIGGTAVLTLGTLEATEVIGRSKDALLDRLKINIDLRNQLQSDGDAFARKYALKSVRRHSELNADIDKLKAALNDKKLILLELPADWNNPKKHNDSNLKKQFPDFNNEGYAE